MFFGLLSCEHQIKVVDSFRIVYILIKFSLFNLVLTITKRRINYKAMIMDLFFPLFNSVSFSSLNLCNSTQIYLIVIFSK